MEYGISLNDKKIPIVETPRRSLVKWLRAVFMGPLFKGSIFLWGKVREINPNPSQDITAFMPADSEGAFAHLRAAIIGPESRPS